MWFWFLWFWLFILWTDNRIVFQLQQAYTILLLHRQELYSYYWCRVDPTLKEWQLGSLPFDPFFFFCSWPNSSCASCSALLLCSMCLASPRRALGYPRRIRHPLTFLGHSAIGDQQEQGWVLLHGADGSYNSGSETSSDCGGTYTSYYKESILMVIVDGHTCISVTQRTVGGMY